MMYLYMKCRYFRCSECKTVLSNCYYAKDTVLFCREHYLEKYGDRCHRCAKIISGPVMVSYYIRYFFLV